jgi:hypothetical protein
VLRPGGGHASGVAFQGTRLPLAFLRIVTIAASRQDSDSRENATVTCVL